VPDKWAPHVWPSRAGPFCGSCSLLPPCPLSVLQLRACMTSLRGAPVAATGSSRAASALVEALNKQIAGIKEAGTYVWGLEERCMLECT
jgi:hypothetical protein